MAIEVFNRYEHKYILDRAAYTHILSVLDTHMELDAYNIEHKPYTIANLYYDTPDDRLIRASLAKPSYKEKLRLRSYGVPDESAKVYLEIKKKYMGLVNKRRTTLRLPEAYAFTETGLLPERRSYMNEQVMHEIEYFLRIYDLAPKVYLAYDRVAYFEKDNRDLRISFDTHIRSRRTELCLEAGDHGEPLLEDGLYLMEIKTALAKPLWLTRTLTECGAVRQSFSKYGTEYMRQLQKTEQTA